jgi:two-component system, NarL family, sensor histidine kinase DesK
MSGITRSGRNRRKPIVEEPLGPRPRGHGRGRGAPPLPGHAILPSHPGMAPRFAITIVCVCMAGFSVAAINNLIYRNNTSPQALTVSACALAITLALQLCHLHWRAEFLRRRWGKPALLVQALMVYAPFWLVGNGWVGTPYFVSASALLTLTFPYDWIIFGALTLLQTAIQIFVAGKDVVDLIYNTVSVVCLGLAIFGLTRLADLVKELHETRAELAQLAVNQERLRFARDLHDLLGYSLSAITLKSELVYRLADRQTARAKEELESVLELSRQALADVRAVSSSYRQMSLSAECASARSMLAATDIKLVMTVMIDERMSGGANTVLATVLREGITNVLRHSKAQHCEIEATAGDGMARLTIVNDGVRAQQARPSQDALRKGTGIENLAQRVQVLGGSLEAGVRPDGWFRLSASVPLTLADDNGARVPEDGGRTASSPERSPDAGEVEAAVACLEKDQGAADHTAA